MTLYKKSGVYRITIADLYYIGSSVNLGNRRQAHLRSLVTGKHRNRVMQRAYEKYGSCEFEVLQFLPEESLIDAEQKLLDLHADQDRCMNISKDAQSYSRTDTGRAALVKNNRIRVWTPEMRSKAAKAHTGRKHSKELRARLSAARQGSDNANAKLTDKDRSRIIKLRLDGVSPKELASKFNVHRGTIMRVCKKSGKTFPKYKFTKEHIDKMKVAFKDRKPHPGVWKRGKRTKLNLDIAREIRASAESGAMLARRYGVCRETVYAVRKGLTWKETNTG